ncbi:Tetratricopeptide repeat 28 [Paramuricea clavata]|uniref:Tetratricopeptide repeat 28 n=1 Tax=Paramuricea clavata TaxID=317549 RepID=A0A7D9DN43_PARCT|nr:Tetratricopeptide repeat 28 [Paramuricea clavata]
MARADSNKSQQLVQEEQSSYTGSTLGPPLPASDDKQKILGILWDSYEDNLIIDIKDVADLAQMVQATKRKSPAKENINNDVVPEECRIEMKVKDQRALDKETLSTMIVHGSKNSISNVINCKDYSILGRLLRVTAVVLKFIKLLKSRVKQEDPPTNSEVTSTDIELARVLWIKELQEEMKLNENFKSWNRDLGLFTDENGTVRCKGRLSNSNLPYSAKYPILLDTAHYLTTLIVRDCHELVMHGGVKATLTKLRSKFWLVCGRNFVRKLLFNCVTCKKQDGRAYKALNSSPLPEFRVKEAPPFTYVGLDYVGPLYVKSTNDLDQKAWICLITCCVSRAAASKELMTLMRDPQVKKYFLQQRMQWSFNLEKAPWWGGFFERLVGSLKRCLKKTIGKARLSYDKLVTAVTEAESILNSRPLSYVSSEDVEEPLTPAHLLSGRRILSLPDRHQENPEDEDFQVDLSTNDLNKRVRYLNDIIEHFWRRWRNEYLVELRNAHKSPKKTVEKSSVEVGDIVLVHDENHPRSFRRIGRIKELVNSTADGKSRARGAVVQAMSKKGKVTTLRRPLQLLYPMEINCKLAKVLYN